LAATLEPLVSALQAALNPPTAAAPTLVSRQPAVSPAESRQVAEQLAKLLSEFDPGAADFIEANPGALRPLFPGEAWRQFEALVQAYSFPDAQARLEQALKDLRSS
jgi:hypothetical protein